MDLDYLEIGRNIYKYRQKSGMKQKELAELVNVSDQHISHIENGHTKLSLVTLVAIANALHIDCNTLLGVTLTGSIESISHQRIHALISDMGADKLGLVVNFCEMLTDYNLRQ